MALLGDTITLVTAGFPACVTLIVCEVTPVALTVTITVRSLVVVLAAAVKVTVPSPLPEAGDTVNHTALLLTVQLVLDVTVHVFCSPPAIKLNDDGETIRVGAACVTLMVCEVTPVPLTVTVAVRWLAVVLAAAVKVTVPSPLPEAGAIVSHAALLLTVQLVLDVTVHVFCSLLAIKLNDDGETVMVGGAVATFTVDTLERTEVAPPVARTSQK